jgi:hypothetical protein
MDDVLPPWLAAALPAEVITFDCIDFGGYGPRGYDPNRIAGRISGVPLNQLTQGQWLAHTNTGSSGSVLVFRDRAGTEVGRAYKASTLVSRELFARGAIQLKFIPSPQGPRFQTGLRP